jgi:hypothetical protein
LQQDEVKKLERKAYERGRKEAEQEAEFRLERRLQWARDTAMRNGNDAIAAIAEFKEASGVELSRWNAGDIGEAVKAVVEIRRRCKVEDLKRLASAACKLAGELAKIE